MTFSSHLFHARASGRCALLTVLVLSATGVACAPAGIVEGTVNDEEIVIQDEAPIYRADQGSDRLLLVISESTDETLRVVSVTIPDATLIDSETDMPLGTEDSGHPFVRLAQGELVVSYRSDGVRVLSTKDTEIIESRSGYLRFTSEAEPYAGSFSAVLETGDHLTGNFLIESATEQSP